MEKAIEAKIKEYFRELNEYRELITVLVTLKKHFSKYENVKACIEPNLQYYEEKGKELVPDLVVMETDTQTGAAFDHKFIRTTNELTIRNEILDVVKYRGKAVIVERNLNIPVNLKDCLLVIQRSLFERINVTLFRIVTKEKLNAHILSYYVDLNEQKIRFHFYNPNNIPLATKVINKFFEKKTRVLDVPMEAYYQKFIRQRPPDFYLITEVYNVILSCAIDPLSPEAKVPYEAILQSLKHYFPRWAIVEKPFYEQLPRARLDRGISILCKIGVARREGKFVIVKRPRGIPINIYLAEKLARYELGITRARERILRKEERREPTQKTILNFIRHEEET